MNMDNLQKIEELIVDTFEKKEEVQDLLEDIRSNCQEIYDLLKEEREVYIPASFVRDGEDLVRSIRSFEPHRTIKQKLPELRRLVQERTDRSEHHEIERIANNIRFFT